MSATKPITQVRPFFDRDTETWSYVVYDHPGGSAAVVDTVLNFDQASGRTSTTGAEEIIQFVRGEKLTVEWILETHAHADHLSAAPYIREQVGGKIAIGDQIRKVQTIFRDLFNLEREFLVDGSQFDHLFHDGETFTVGELQGRVIYVPGHTPADMAWLIGDALFVGDTLFMPDVGSARCDFPGGDATTLYRSAQKLLALPEDTRMFMCHDYPPEGGREYRCETTVGEQKRNNIHLHEGISEEEFVAMRNKRDATLPMPRLIIPSIQVNIRAGQMPPPEDNGTTYLKVPINTL
ncbi:MBL fold metallo-hydrolase [Microbulbifer thermotolerans]|uniref:MBL fold metallo-hydrolase n=1 Tax=Microbulbifer thermotolerans TaxID=252514 RepID=A0AB35HV30_MICTH|nr:MBL fold metallo-hydrolase [Microbulbifer thermotolerans]MCX2801372.1 MBL fold metallo-hydrolase [Microbulbifer thermotolerans]